VSGQKHRLSSLTEPTHHSFWLTVH